MEMQRTQKSQNNLEKTTAEKLKPQPKCPSTDEWINKTQYSYRKKYYSAIKRNEILIYIHTHKYTHIQTYIYIYIYIYTHTHTHQADKP